MFLGRVYWGFGGRLQPVTFSAESKIHRCWRSSRGYTQRWQRRVFYFGPNVDFSHLYSGVKSCVGGATLRFMENRTRPGDGPHSSWSMAESCHCSLSLATLKLVLVLAMNPSPAPQPGSCTRMTSQPLNSSSLKHTPIGRVQTCLRLLHGPEIWCPPNRFLVMPISNNNNKELDGQHPGKTFLCGDWKVTKEKLRSREFHHIRQRAAAELPQVSSTFKLYLFF